MELGVSTLSSKVLFDFFADTQSSKDERAYGRASTVIKPLKKTGVWEAMNRLLIEQNLWTLEPIKCPFWETWVYCHGSGAHSKGTQRHLYTREIGIPDRAECISASGQDNSCYHGFSVPSFTYPKGSRSSGHEFG